MRSVLITLIYIVNIHAIFLKPDSLDENLRHYKKRIAKINIFSSSNFDHLWEKCETLASNSKSITTQQAISFEPVSKPIIQTTTPGPVILKPSAQVYQYGTSLASFNNQFKQINKYPTYNVAVDTSTGFKYYKNANIMSGNFGKRNVLSSRVKRINSINIYSNNDFGSLEEWCRIQYPGKFPSNKIVTQTTNSFFQTKMPFLVQKTSNIITKPSLITYSTFHNRPIETTTTQISKNTLMQSFWPTQAEIQKANNNFRNVFGWPLFPPNAFKINKLEK